MLERLNEEIRRRTYIVRIFPNTESCLRLVRALAVETNENWMEANRYINMGDLREHKKLELRKAAWPPHFAELDAHNPEHIVHLVFLSIRVWVAKVVIVLDRQ
jgi:hypothetical protein